eukprot:scaffold245763_cov31-Tisochrysis_lutea.AAC.10
MGEAPRALPLGFNSPPGRLCACRPVGHAHGLPLGMGPCAEGLFSFYFYRLSPWPWHHRGGQPGRPR